VETSGADSMAMSFPSENAITTTINDAMYITLPTDLESICSESHDDVDSRFEIEESELGEFLMDALHDHEMASANTKEELEY